MMDKIIIKLENNKIDFLYKGDLIIWNNEYVNKTNMVIILSQNFNNDIRWYDPLNNYFGIWSNKWEKFKYEIIR